VVASGDKRGEVDTTGAFGLGFIAVYQITDRPQIISSGRHWLIDEMQPEEQRIEVCPGCDACRDESLPPTRFIFPWARTPDSGLRRALRAGTVPEDLAPMVAELEHSLPASLLFLKKLDAIVLKQDGRPRLDLRRVRMADRTILEKGGQKQEWHLLRGSLGDTGRALKQGHPGRIEAKRKDEVVVAIAEPPVDLGIICAFLPTQYSTGLPLHIHADFFPTGDRKGIVLESDYQSEWNRAAIAKAGELLAAAAGRLTRLVGPKTLWSLIAAVQRVSEEPGRDASFKDMWSKLEPAVAAEKVVLTTAGEWRVPRETVQLLKEEEEVAIPILQDLGLPIVHPAS
jgi:hypothetical protein